MDMQKTFADYFKPNPAAIVNENVIRDFLE